VGDGAHSSPPETWPTGSVSTRPSRLSKRTSTRSAPDGSPVLRAKKRTVGVSRPTHTPGDVALSLPVSRSAPAPPPSGELSATTSGPEPCQPPAPAPRSPLGARKYHEESPHGANGWLTAWSQSAEVTPSRSPAWALGAATRRASITPNAARRDERRSGERAK